MVIYTKRGGQAHPPKRTAMKRVLLPRVTAVVCFAVVFSIAGTVMGLAMSMRPGP